VNPSQSQSATGTGHTPEAEVLVETVKDLARRSSSLPVFAALVEIGLALDTLSEQAHTGLHGLGQRHGFEELSTDSRLQKLLAETP
jgi:hypothetical protein